jgi:uncharacterized membrane protein
VTEKLPDQEKNVSVEEVGGAPAEPVHPLVAFGDEDLKAVMKRAARLTAILGIVVAVVLCFAMNWRDGALFAVGTAISILSIFEWSRLIRLFNLSMDAGAASGKKPRGAALTVSLFMVRLIFFAAAIYVSLRCFHDSKHGSPIVLACGLALGLVGLIWEALRVLRG